MLLWLLCVPVAVAVAFAVAVVVAVAAVAVVCGVVVVVVVAVVSEAELTEQTAYVNMSLRTNWQEPSSSHRCECSRARRLALNSRTTGGARKMGVNRGKKPSNAAKTATAKSRVPFFVAQLDCPRTLAMT